MKSIITLLVLIFCSTLSGIFTPKHSFIQALAAENTLPVLPVCDIPSPPTILTSGHTWLELQWTDPTAVEGDYYEVEFRTPGSDTWLPSISNEVCHQEFILIFGPPPPMAKVYGLEPCVFYEFRVVKYCLDGSTVYSNASTLRASTQCANPYFSSANFVSGLDACSMIESIQFAGIADYNTSCGGGDSDLGYEFYQGGTATVNLGEAPDCQVNINGNDGFHYLNAWIDFNKDYDFDDPGEHIFAGNYIFSGFCEGATAIFPVSIPITATLGTTRMRIISSYNSDAQSGSGILMDGGRVEDLSVMISGNTGCVSTITAASATSFCTGGSVVLNGPIAAGNSYQWKKNGIDIPGATQEYYTANSTGSYTLVVSQNTCMATSTAVVVTAAPAIQLGSVSTNGLTGSFTLSGGYPQLDGSNYASVSMQLQGNPGVSAALSSGPFGHNGVVTFSVPQTGAYDVVVTDANGCSGTGTVTVSGGSGGTADVAPCIEWQKCLGGSIGFDFASSLLKTSDGGFLIGGITESNDGNVFGSHGSQDFWVVKLDENGQLSWQKALGGSNPDALIDAKTTPDGGFLLAGNASSTDGDVTGNHGVNDFWTAKLSSSGDLIWQKSFGGTSYDEGSSIELTSDGGFIMVGSTASNDGQVSGNHGNFDYWVIKVDASNNIVWQKTFGGSAFDNGRRIISTPDGGFLLMGTTESTDGNISLNHGLTDIWVVKIDASGNVLWQKSFGGSDDEYAYDIKTTADNGFIFVGQTRSNNGDISFNHGKKDLWIVKIDASGSIIWQKTIGGSEDDQASSIQPTADNGFVIGGYTTSTNGDLLGTQYQGQGDAWLLKISNTGSLIWQKTLGGSNGDGASAIQFLDDGLILAGETGSNDGDVSGNHGGEADIWVVKLKTPSLPTCTSLSNPIPNSTNVPVTTSLNWAKASGCIDGYHLCVGTTPNGTELLNNQMVTDTFYQLAQVLPTGATIYVRIFPFNSLGEPISCQEFVFTTPAGTLCDVKRDSLALVALYNATGGDNWLNKTNWMIPGQPISSWYGVLAGPDGCAQCIDMEGSPDCFSVGGNGTGNNLVGVLPPEIGDFSNLRALMLPFNTLSGSIPPEIGQLTYLQNLYLFNNQLTGGIPQEMSNMSSLIDLQLYQNELSGPIPPELNNLKNLAAMLFYNNKLSGTIPNFDLPKLDKLWLAGNLLEGTIPNFQMPNLLSIGLDRNRLTGTVPDFSGTAVRGLGVFNNRLTFSGMPYHVAQNLPEGFNYNPQDSIYADTLILRNPGEDLTVDLGIDANESENRYQWFKAGNPDGAPLALNKRIFSNLQATDAGTYYVQVTNATAPDLTLYSRAIRIQVGCTGVPAPDISSPAAFCGSAATLSVSVNYPTPPQWSNGQSGASIQISTSGTYTVTVTDASGCTNSNSVTLIAATPPNQPTITGPNFVCGTSATLSVPANAPNPQWSSGQNGASIQVTTSGTYTVTVTNTAGCTNSNSLTINIATPPNAPTISGPNALCSSSATLSVPGNAPNPMWSTGQNGASIQITTPGNYTVTVTDVAGCTNSSSITVNAATPPPIPTINAPSALCGASATLSVSVNYPTPPQWSNGQSGVSIQISAPGAYTVTVTDAGGCTNSNSVTLIAGTPPNQPTITGPNFVCGTSATLSVPANAPNPQWSSGQNGASIQVTTSGTYTVTVTNTAGCTNTNSLTVNISTPPALPAITGPSALCGVSATLSVPGNAPNPMWSTGQNGASIQVTTAGTYTVTVTDAAGCTNSNSLTINAGTTPNQPTINGPNALCSGSTTLTVSGSYPTPPQWSSGQSGASITISSAGIYTVTITDFGGCTSTNSKQLDATAPPFSTAIIGPNSFCSGNITLYVVGNFSSPPFWSNGQIGPSITVNAGGNYAVTVTDAGGCTGSGTHQVTKNQDIQVLQDTVLCPGSSVSFCGQSVTQAGAIDCSFTTASGCDSTITMQVKVFDPSQFAAMVDQFQLTGSGNAQDLVVTDNDTYGPDYVLKILQKPMHGSAGVLNNKTLRYTPDPNISGPDSLQYGLCPPGNCLNFCATAWVWLRAQSNSVDAVKGLFPNVITPDGNGINDDFDPVQILTDNGVVVESAELYIINRWGEVVHFSKEGRWDGKQHEQALPQATYYYRLHIKAGGDFELRGPINLLR